jgi:hypothetical protein
MQFLLAHLHEPSDQRTGESLLGDAGLYYTEARLIYEGKAAHHRDPNYLEEMRLIERYQKA